jgi:hypothetical protein
LRGVVWNKFTDVSEELAVCIIALMGLITQKTKIDIFPAARTSRREMKFKKSYPRLFLFTRNCNEL